MYIYIFKVFCILEVVYKLFHCRANEADILVVVIDCSNSSILSPVVSNKMSIDEFLIQYLKRLDLSPLTTHCDTGN